jgi:hypothetical protein
LIDLIAFLKRALYWRMRSDVNVVLTGLIDLEKKEEYRGAKIEQVPPGMVETYSIDAEENVHLVSSKAFNKTGEPPKYRTLVTDLGMGIP